MIALTKGAASLALGYAIVGLSGRASDKVERKPCKRKGDALFIALKPKFEYAI